MSEEQYVTYELYDTPYAKYLQKEIELATVDQKEVYEPSDFNSFDTLHYCGDDYLKSQLEALRNQDEVWVMDAGSGNGITSRAMAKEFGFNVVSVDYVQHFTDVANQLNALCGLSDKITAIRDDLTTIDLEGKGYLKKFDAVVSIQAFLHIQDKRALFATCNKALKDGGLFYIEDFTVNDKSILQADDVEAMEHLGLHNIDQQEYTAALVDCGFELRSWENFSRDWATYIYDRAERFLTRKEYILSTHGQEVWNTRMMGGITNSTRLYTDLGLTKEEFVAKYPLTYAQLGDEFVDYWIFTKPQRFHGSYLVAVKTRDV